MLAAFLEWFLWLAAFMYCLVKVYQKAEHWTVKLLAVVIATLFTALRLVMIDYRSPRCCNGVNANK
jgi:chitin synthase